ncbi:MAG: PepSY domain-containing protein [Burkholderiaceae bacterium]|jgi:predicted SpoU family rRNA methylase|nr:PepSY domain-containing protein [Burkholderiaceae bacterium]
MIEQDQAIEIARKYAEGRKWRFGGPFNVLIRRNWSGTIRHFDIETNAGSLGTKAFFAIDAKTGRIISSAYIPR